MKKTIPSELLLECPVNLGITDHSKVIPRFDLSVFLSMAMHNFFGSSILFCSYSTSRRSRIGPRRYFSLICGVAMRPDVKSRELVRHFMIFLCM
jgi:hypothetical protein